MNNPIRQRTRQSQTAAPAAAPGPNLLRTGADAEAMRAREAERAEERRNRPFKPFRLWTPPGGVSEYIILDSDIDQCPVFYEHAMPDNQNGGKRTDFQMCVKELEHCPLCERDKEGYYIQMISIIDLKGYTKGDGTHVPHTKRLLGVKFQQQGFFRRLCKELMGGNMRGAHIVSHRENSQMSPGIGNPSNAIGEDCRIIRYEEAQLEQAFGHPEVKSRDGTRVIKAPNSDLYPYDYNALFPGTTAEELRRRYGGVVPAGSNAEMAAEWGQGQAAPAPAPVAGIAPIGAQPAHGVAAPAPVAAVPAAAVPMPVAAPAPIAAPAPAPVAAPAPVQAGGIQRQAQANHGEPHMTAAPGAHQPTPDVDDDIPF